MNKSEVISFVLLLIKKIEGLEETVIWERSGSIQRDLDKNKEKVKKYKERLNELLK